MTRFDAATPTDRRKLFAEAVRAHRERGGPYLTVEPEPTGAELDEGEDLDREAPEHSTPWLQFADRTVNLDCTDEEYDRLTALLDEFPEFRVEELNDPEDAPGRNVRITARSDPPRLAEFFDRVFLSVYGREEDYRVWVTEL